MSLGFKEYLIFSAWQRGSQCSGLEDRRSVVSLHGRGTNQTSGQMIVKETLPYRLSLRMVIEVASK